MGHLPARRRKGTGGGFRVEVRIISFLGVLTGKREVKWGCAKRTANAGGRTNGSSIRNGGDAGTRERRVGKLEHEAGSWGIHILCLRIMGG